MCGWVVGRFFFSRSCLLRMVQPNEFSEQIFLADLAGIEGLGW